MASTVVMASSTSSASAMISAPSEMRCRSMFARSISANTSASVSGMVSATTVPARTPSAMKPIARMIAMACQSEVVKSEMASSTVTGWSATRMTSMPRGSSPTMEAICDFNLSPRVRMSPPSRMAMASPSAGSPLTRNIDCGGST